MANHPARTECPAIRELVQALRGVIPELRGNKIGTIRNDGSRHTAGLAADIMLDSRNSYQKMIADDIIDALIVLQPQMGWHDIIYVDWIANSTGGAPQPFYFHIPSGAGGYGGRRLSKNPINAATGRAHENHIHVDWVDFSLRIANDTQFVFDWPQDAQRTGFAADLMSRLMFSSRL
jgi:hypothetical protein